MATIELTLLDQTATAASKTAAKNNQTRKQQGGALSHFGENDC